MFDRNILQELKKWRGKDIRKPLIIRGACQVGKTTAVRQFSTGFKNFIYLNLELPADRKPFEEFSDFETLLQALFFLKNKPLADRADTLIFVDEIQELPEALQQLRYFYEDASDIPVLLRVRCWKVCSILKSVSPLAG
jgi:predicted AAA+ superfamily ATPase